MMAHIRYATQGEVSMENVHPFNRVWKGVQMCFCHVRRIASFVGVGLVSSTHPCLFISFGCA
jgi:glutamine phosphoribosylpyrophosphate amidotransferase